MSLGVRVLEREAEKVRRELVAGGHLERGKRAVREGGFVIFPVKESPDLPYETVQREFETVERKTFQDYLREFLEEDEVREVRRSFDVIGDLAILEIPDELEGREVEIAQALMRAHKAIRGVFKKGSEVRGEERVRALVHLAGEERGVAVHREHGCRYKMDIRKVYFSPRLGYERRRVLEKVGRGETVVDLFAGVGPFSIPLAKYRGARVYAVDINPSAVDYLRENVRLNKVAGLVVPLLGDCRAVTPRGVADRVIMNLPKRSPEFLDVALGALKGGGVIHLYAIATRQDLYAPLEREVRKAFQGLGADMEVLERKVVRPYSPRQYHVVLDIKVTSRS